MQSCIQIQSRKMKLQSLLFVTVMAIVLTTALTQACIDGDVSLYPELDVVEPEDSVTGVVQVCVNGTWRTACRSAGPWWYYRWNTHAADLVCRQLGYSGEGSTAHHTCSEHPRNGYIIQINCEETTSGIRDCHFSMSTRCPTTCWGKTGKATVTCIKDNCTDGTLRLVGGSTYREGRVEVCRNKQWGTVCYRKQLDLAEHICSELGFSSQAVSNVISTTSPQVNCTIDTNNRLSCGNITDSGLCARGLAVECPSFRETCLNSTKINDQTRYTDNSIYQTIPSSSPCIPNSAAQNTTMDPTSPITSALGAVIVFLVLLEVGTVIAWVAYTVTRKRLSSSPTSDEEIGDYDVLDRYRPKPKPSESNVDPSYSSLGRNYDTATTSDEGIGDYDVIDCYRPKPKPANPPSVKVEASNSEDESNSEELT